MIGQCCQFGAGGTISRPEASIDQSADQLAELEKLLEEVDTLISVIIVQLQLGGLRVRERQILQVELRRALAQRDILLDDLIAYDEPLPVPDLPSSSPAAGGSNWTKNS